MSEYHKIQTLFKRDMSSKCKTLLEGEWTSSSRESRHPNRRMTRVVRRPSRYPSPRGGIWQTHRSQKPGPTGMSVRLGPRGPFINRNVR